MIFVLDDSNRTHVWRYTHHASGTNEAKQLGDQMTAVARSSDDGIMVDLLILFMAGEGFHLAGSFSNNRKLVFQRS